MAVAEHEWTLTEETTGKAFGTILTRLEHNLSNPEYTRMLQRSPYERSKASANVEYARTLLLKMEQYPTSTNSRNAKHPVGQSTAQQHQTLKKCEDRLYELTQASAVEGKQPAGVADSDDEEDDEDMQDILRRFAPAKPTSSGLDTEPPDTTEDTKDTTTDAQTTAAAATLTSTLRSRRPGAQEPSKSAATTTGSSHQPFAPKATTTTSTTDALLTSHTLTQEDLTDSLLTLAKALNNSTQAFSSALAESNPLVDAATKALDKNVTGMEGAERRMGMLRRMTEGKGWWGRLTLWGWIGVGWVVLLVVMFVMPKLRM